jgi:hypothetical protein
MKTSTRVVIGIAVIVASMFANYAMAAPVFVPRAYTLIRTYTPPPRISKPSPAAPKRDTSNGSSLAPALIGAGVGMITGAGSVSASVACDKADPNLVCEDE